LSCVVVLYCYVQYKPFTDQTEKNYDWLTFDNMKTLYTNYVYELNPLLLVLSVHFDCTLCDFKTVTGTRQIGGQETEQKLKFVFLH
jgi:hypothetical protein